MALVIVGALVAVFDLSGAGQGQPQHAMPRPRGYMICELPVGSEVQAAPLPLDSVMTF